MYAVQECSSILSDLKRICWTFRHCCLTPWLEEEVSYAYWAVHTKGDPWREYLITAWLEEDLLHTHALLFDLLARFATRLLSCSVTCLWLSEEESLCEPFTSVCSITYLRLPKRSRCVHPLPVFALLPASGCPKRNRCVNPLPVSAPLTYLRLSEEESLCELPTSVCSITYLRLSEGEPLCAFLTRFCSVICLRLSEEESLWRIPDQCLPKKNAVWTSYAAWRRRESDQPVLF